MNDILHDSCVELGVESCEYEDEMKWAEHIHEIARRHARLFIKLLGIFIKRAHSAGDREITVRALIWCFPTVNAAEINVSKTKLNMRLELLNAAEECEPAVLQFILKTKASALFSTVFEHVVRRGAMALVLNAFRARLEGPETREPLVVQLTSADMAR